MDKADFRILVRRVPGYEPAAAVRFEMREGYGELHIGERKRAAPAASGELSEAPGEQVRMGRFVHVLSSGKRRQSYSLSRLDDERLQRLSEDKWVQLEPITEFGIRYLDLPAARDGDVVAAVQVSANPSPPRGNAPAASAASTASPKASSSLLDRARSSSNKQHRHTPDRPSSREVTAEVPRISSTSPASSRVSSPAPRALETDPGARSSRPQPVAHVDQDAPTLRHDVPVSMAIEPSLGSEAVAQLSTNDLRSKLIEEMGKVAALQAKVAEMHRQLESSRQRESDVVGLIARWSKRG